MKKLTFLQAPVNQSLKHAKHSACFMHKEIGIILLFILIFSFGGSETLQQQKLQIMLQIMLLSRLWFLITRMY